MCTDITSCLSRYTRRTQITKTCFFVLLSVLLPAIAWTGTLYIGSPASGRMFYFIPTNNPTDPISITASQNVKENERGNSRHLLLILASALAIQLLLTLLILVKICYVSYKSTLSVVLKKGNTMDDNLASISKQNQGNVFSKQNGKEHLSSMDKKLDNKHHNKKMNLFNQRTRRCSPNANCNLKESIECVTLDPNHYAKDDPDAITITSDDTVRRVPHLNSTNDVQIESRCTRKSRAILVPTAEDVGNSISGTGDYKINLRIAKQNDGNYLYQNDGSRHRSPKEKSLDRKQHNKHSEPIQQKRRQSDPNANCNLKKSIERMTSNQNVYSTDDPCAITAIPDDIVCCSPQLNITEDTQNEIRCTRKTRVILLPTAEDYNNSSSVTGVHKFPVPLTKVVLCLSNSDISCSISLTLQLTCLCITHVLTVFTFLISGQEVSLERYMLSCYSLEAALLINTMVDPIVCIIFSSNYRNAAKTIMTLRRSTYKTSKYTQCPR